MKITAVLVAALAFATLAVPAGSAATPTDRKIAALQRQVKTLQRQVKLLTTRVAQANSGVSAAFIGSTCEAALTADLFQGTWAVIDQVAGRTIFGAQTQLSDYGNCGALRSPTVPRPPLQAPPNISIFTPLLEWLHVPLGSSSLSSWYSLSQ
jgi:outer membrane murein-binding lipoprotein Lpp